MWGLFLPRSPLFCMQMVKFQVYMIIGFSCKLNIIFSSKKNLNIFKNGSKYIKKNSHKRVGICLYCPILNPIFGADFKTLDLSKNT